MTVATYTYVTVPGNISDDTSCGLNSAPVLFPRNCRNGTLRVTPCNQTKSLITYSLLILIYTKIRFLSPAVCTGGRCIKALPFNLFTLKETD